MHFLQMNILLMIFSVIGIEKLYKDETYRRFRENLWKKKINTYMPFGINEREHYCL